MTSEEIKQTYSMRDILNKCGLPQPNRSGFIQCPFHKGDREAQETEQTADPDKTRHKPDNNS